MRQELNETKNKAEMYETKDGAKMHSLAGTI